MEIILNIVLSSVAISLCLWISKQNPVLSGFLMSMPLSTMIILMLNSFQNPDPNSGVILAKSIVVGIATSFVFFLPFLLSEKFGLSFWTCYASGVGLLIGSYFVHRQVMQFLS